MKALIQRVLSASVSVGDDIVARIKCGLVVFVGVAADDSDRDVEYISRKILDMRIFSDEQDKFNLSVLDSRGSVVLISQFTLLADTRKGRRPSFVNAAPPQKAENLFNSLVTLMKSSDIDVQAGRFRQHMLVELINDGPVTIMLDSKM